MTAPLLNRPIILTGPTGSGKSTLGLALAECLDAEIISLDSMSLYRSMDIGTAKPTVADRQRVTHHLIDVLDPWESATVAWWLDEARRHSGEISGRGKQVLFVGGTALYLKAFLYGIFNGPPADEELRRLLLGKAEAEGTKSLHLRLAEVDPITAGRLHPNDVRRVVRALEVWHLTGRPMSEWQTQWRTPPADLPAVVWIDRPRAELYSRIDRRVLEMIGQGLVEEVRQLTELPRPLSREAGQALGYKEILAYLAGQLTFAEAVQLIQTRSRQFAKRQISWFRHLTGSQPVPAELTEVLARVTITH
jgi:tRNA dimethylallyltransferase